MGDTDSEKNIFKKHPYEHDCVYPMQFRAYDDVLPEGARRDYESVPRRLVRPQDIREGDIIGRPVDLRHEFDDMRGVVENWTLRGPNLFIDTKVDANGKRWIEKNNWHWGEADKKGERKKEKGVGMSISFVPPVKAGQDKYNDPLKFVSFTLTNDPKRGGCFLVENYSNDDKDKKDTEILEFTLIDFEEMSTTQQGSQNTNQVPVAQAQTQGGNGVPSPSVGTPTTQAQGGAGTQNGSTQVQSPSDTQAQSQSGTQGGTTKNTEKKEDVMDIDMIMSNSMKQYDSIQPTEQRSTYEKLGRKAMERETLIKEQESIISEYRKRDGELMDAEATELQEYIPKEVRETMRNDYESGKDVKWIINMAKHNRDRDVGQKRAPVNQHVNSGETNQTGTPTSNQTNTSKSSNEAPPDKKQTERPISGHESVFDLLTTKAKNSIKRAGIVPYHPQLGSEGRQNQAQSQTNGIPSNMKSGPGMSTQTQGNSNQSTPIENFSNDKSNSSQGYKSSYATKYNYDQLDLDIEAELARSGMTVDEFLEEEEKKLTGKKK